MAKRSVIITNAASPVGEACARRFGVAGDRLILVDADEAAGRAVAEAQREQKREAVFVAADPSKKLDVHNIVAEAIEGDARIDVLVHNQITYSDKPFSTLTVDDFDAAYQADVRSAFFMAQAVMKQMVRAEDAAPSGGGPGGALIMLLAGNGALNGDAAFAAAQGALGGLVGALAAAGASHKIRANAIRLGAVRGAVYDDDQLKELSDTSLLRAPGDPADVAELAYFLSSPASGYVTGATLDLDGGGLFRPDGNKYEGDADA